MCKLFKVSRSCYYNWIEKGCVVNRVDVDLISLSEMFLNKQELLMERED
jgi:hypothetical protein